MRNLHLNFPFPLLTKEHKSSRKVFLLVEEIMELDGRHTKLNPFVWFKSFSVFFLFSCNKRFQSIDAWATAKEKGTNDTKMKNFVHFYDEESRMAIFEDFFQLERLSFDVITNELLILFFWPQRKGKRSFDDVIRNAVVIHKNVFMYVMSLYPVILMSKQNYIFFQLAKAFDVVNPILTLFLNIS